MQGVPAHIVIYKKIAAKWIFEYVFKNSIVSGQNFGDSVQVFHKHGQNSNKSDFRKLSDVCHRIVKKGLNHANEYQ